MGGVAFIPHVGSFFQGISLTASIPLNKTVKAETIHQLYQEMYGAEPLIKVHPVNSIPEVRDISEHHHVEVGGFKVHSSGSRVVIVATIDNLLKGAATQALQNINLALGLEETKVIPLPK